MVGLSVGRRLLGVAALALVLGAGCGTTKGEQRSAEAQAAPAPVCQEDEACWDWRTMGNQQRGICVDGKNVIEHADGSRMEGGRGCQLKPIMERCLESTLLVTRTMPLPVGWKVLCGEGRSIPNGVSDPATKTIRIGDSAGDKDDVTLRHVVAHEICHAVLYVAGDKAQGNPAKVAQAEANADRCAAERGF